MHRQQRHVGLPVLVGGELVGLGHLPKHPDRSDRLVGVGHCIANFNWLQPDDRA